MLGGFTTTTLTTFGRTREELDFDMLDRIGIKTIEKYLSIKYPKRIRKQKIQKIITGITVEEQMSKAKEILDNEIIPRNKEYEKIKNKNVK